MKKWLLLVISSVVINSALHADFMTELAKRDRKNPLTEYMHEAADSFEQMLAAIHRGAAKMISDIKSSYALWKAIYALNQAALEQDQRARKNGGRHRIINFYRTLLHTHGSDSVASVAYTSRESQWARFKALVENTVPDKESALTLLDLGCGMGDLYGHRPGWGHGTRRFRKIPRRAFFGG